MLVDRADGSCRTCGGVLEIVDCDDATMSVECQECGDGYDVETDAFGDGCMKYYVALMAAKLEGGEDE